MVLQWHHMQWVTEASVPDGGQIKRDVTTVSETCDSSPMHLVWMMRGSLTALDKIFPPLGSEY